VTVIAEMSNALGSGIATAMIFIPITYFAMRKQFKLKPLSKFWRPFGYGVFSFAILHFFVGESDVETPAGILMQLMLPIVVSASILYWTNREQE